MFRSIRIEKVRDVILCSVFGLLVGSTALGAPQQPPVVTSGEWVLGDFDGDGLEDEASIDWVTFNVTEGTTVNFDALVFESAVIGVDLNGDGELTRADAGMVLVDEDKNLLLLHDDAPPGVYGDDGSQSRIDGNFDYTFESAGTYTLAISANGYWLTPEDALDGYIDYRIIGPAFRNEFGDAIDHADWQLTLTVENGAVWNVQVKTLGTPATPNPVTAAACTYLWPPNQKLVGMGLEPGPTYELQVYTNDPSADQSDAILDEAGVLQLRAERESSSIGRVYLVVAISTGENPGELIDCCAAIVPHDKSAAAISAIEAEAALAQIECVVYRAPPTGYVLIGP